LSEGFVDMNDIISCPYCDSYHLRQPISDEEQDEVESLMTNHCKQEHMDDIICEIVRAKIAEKLSNNI
jgi:hypothetical protein